MSIHCEIERGWEERNSINLGILSSYINKFPQILTAKQNRLRAAGVNINVIISLIAIDFHGCVNVCLLWKGMMLCYVCLVLWVRNSQLLFGEPKVPCIDYCGSWSWSLWSRFILVYKGFRLIIS